MKKAHELGLSPDEQMDHGLGLIRDFEVSPDAPNAQRYLAAGVASCLTALWRKADVGDRGGA